MVLTRVLVDFDLRLAGVEYEELEPVRGILLSI